MTVAIRIEPHAPSRFDVQITRLSWARLTRGPTGLCLECRDDEGDRAGVLVTRGGARPCEPVGPTSPPRGSLAALMSDLEPVIAAGIVDRVDLRRVDESEATARLWRRSWLGRRADRMGMRIVLRGDDTMFAWRRVVWARPATLRSALLRRARPVIFDGDAIEHGRERYAFARDDLLTRWLAG